MSHGLHVLVVEDDVAAAAAVQRALERRGHRVSVASCGEEALAAAPHDVLVSALALPDIDGLELCERVLARPTAPRVVLVSDEPSFDECRRALRLGAVDFLPKPFRLKDLVTAVERSHPERAGCTALGRRKGSRDASFARAYLASPRVVDTAVRDLLAYCLRCDIGPSTRARIGTAVADVIDNACRHGYAGGSGEIEVYARVDPRSLRVSVRDLGVGFDPDTHPAAIAARDGGLVRAGALAEELVVDSRPGSGTEVRLAFGCSHVDYDDGRKVDLSDLDYLSPQMARSVVERLREKGGDHVLHLSPATAVTIGRLLAGPDPRSTVRGARGG